MRLDDLEQLLRRVPCPLLRLHLSSGQVFEVNDPDAVVLDRSAIELLLPPDGRRVREAVISLVHIVWIEVVSPED